jgi:hypothetical protein
MDGSGPVNYDFVSGSIMETCVNCSKHEGHLNQECPDLCVCVCVCVCAKGHNRYCGLAHGPHV